jgi:WD40 repeat protein
VAIEPGLIAELIADVNSQPGTLPLLQYALTQAFDHDAGDVLTVDAYRSIGGLAGALGRRAEELWQAADGAEQVATRRLFGRLVTLGEGAADTRRRVRISELGDDAATRAGVDRFGAARLLTFDRDPATREPTVEVAHEALIREWSRLRGWLDDDRERLRLQRHLTNAAFAWVDRDRDPNELYRGARLDASESLLTGDTVTLNEIETEFMQASLQRRLADEAAERVRVRRLRRLVAATAIVAVVALLAGAVALVQWRRADDQAADAATNAEHAATNEALAQANAAQADSNAAEAAASAELADERATEAEQARARGDLERVRAVALSTAGQSPTIAALLAVESHRIEPSTDSLDVLHRVMTEIPGYRGSVPAGPYLTAALLDDGVTLVAVGAETIDVWDLRRRELTTSIDQASPIGAAVVRVIDDDHVAVLGDRRDETIVYDLASGTEVTRIAHGAIVNDISVSPDGERGAFAMEGGAVEVWNLGNDELASTLDTGDIDVYFARWSPDDGLLAVVTLQSEVQLWDVDEQARVWSTGPSEAAIVNQVRPFAATFTPDGSRYVVLSGSLGGGLRILDSSDGSDVVPPMPAPGLRGFALGDIYWIDDATVAIPSDGNVMAFPLDTPAAGRTIIDRFVSEGNSVVYSAAIDQHIVAGLSGLEFWSADGSGPLERVIPAPPEQLAALEAGGGTILASLAPDGTRLIMSTLHIPVNPPATSFDLTQDPPVATTLDPMITMGFGEFTLVGLPSFVWQVLDVDLRPLGAPVPLPFDFSEVGVSEDGRYVAIGRLGGMADIYTGSGELVGTVELGGPAEFAGAQVLPTFTSDGEFLALGTTDGRSGLWATEALERIDRPDVHENSWTFALGPWLFVAGGGDTFQRIDPTTMEPVGGAVGLNGFDSPGYAKVDPTHARLAATGSEVVKVFDLDAERQLGRDLAFRGGAGRAQFSADGAILAVPTTDGITLWNFDTDRWPDIACQMAGRNLTRDEWEEFGPRTIAYRATCPRYPIES